MKLTLLAVGRLKDGPEKALCDKVLLTRNLKEALSLVETRVLDHFIVAGNQAISFAERGLL